MRIGDSKATIVEHDWEDEFTGAAAAMAATAPPASLLGMGVNAVNMKK